MGTANCPGAPQLDFFFGRAPPVAPAPDLTVPEPTDSVDAIIERFADAGFTVDEIVALLSSHTVAAAVSPFPITSPLNLELTACTSLGRSRPGMVSKVMIADSGLSTDALP